MAFLKNSLSKNDNLVLTLIAKTGKSRGKIAVKF